jgi:HD-like signal output (HDOD) protein
VRPASQIQEKSRVCRDLRIVGTLLIPASELRLGQTIVEDVSNVHGQVVLTAGTVVARLHTSLLRAWGIKSVAVADEAPGNSALAAPASPAPAAGEPPVARDEHPVLLALTTAAARFAEKLGTTPAKPFIITPTKPAPRLAGKPTGPPLSPDTIAAKAGNLASLPSVYTRLEKIINNPSSSAADITKILQHDQALTARLLRIGNSAFYGFPRRVEGLEEAVRIIGTRQLQDLVLATVVLTQFKGVDARLVSMRSFWRHSLACGIAARALAALRRESNTERFFVAGLMHDIGSLVLYQQLPERSQAALERHRNTPLPLEEAERAAIGCDHGAVGAAIMSLWKLPEFFKDVSASHHSQGHRQYTAGLAMVHIADLLALALGLGSNGEVRLPRFSEDAWKATGLAPDCLERVAEEVVSKIEEAEQMFVGDDLPA